MLRRPSPLAAPAVEPPAEHGETLAGLVSSIEPLPVTAPTLRAYEAFSANQTLYAIAIVDVNSVPVGIINRFRFFELLSRPFGRDLLTHRAITDVMDSAPLVVDERMSLDQLSEIVVDEGNRYIFDGYIVTRDGGYLGIGTGYSLMRRLTERRQTILYHLAHHDGLTGLPNRQLFGDRLSQALAHAERYHRILAVLFVDVDRFKAVNDSLGHAAGDQMLKGVAERLREGVRAHDTVARLSGDEFALVLTELTEPLDAEVIADKLLQSLRQVHRIDKKDINLSGSIGIAVFPHDGRTGGALTRAADDALYYAKQFRNTSQRYSASMVRSAADPLLEFSTVRRALDFGELEVHYQPQVCAGTRALYGFEALVRWRGSDGFRPTPQLIRAAEDAGLISAITDVVMREAMRRLLGWRRGPAPHARLAINVSGVEMRDGALLPMLCRHLAETGFPPDALELEITESSVMRSDASSVAVLDAIKQLGIRLSVDDFGTGYSSLSQLQRLPVDAIKIDQSFVASIGDQGNGGVIAQAIIVMAHSLGLTVTGEGIEREEQAVFLEGHGCDRLQGYLMARPMAPEAIDAFLADPGLRR